jgi:hypothetical protein
MSAPSDAGNRVEVVLGTDVSRDEHAQSISHPRQGSFSRNGALAGKNVR